MRLTLKGKGDKWGSGVVWGVKGSFEKGLHHPQSGNQPICKIWSK